MKKIFQVKFHTSVKIGAKEALHVNSNDFNIELNDSETLFSIHQLRQERHWVAKVPAVNAAWWREMTPEAVAATEPKFTNTIVSDSSAAYSGVSLAVESAFVPPTPLAQQAPVTIRRRAKRGNAQADA